MWHNVSMRISRYDDDCANTHPDRLLSNGLTVKIRTDPAREIRGAVHFRSPWISLPVSMTPKVHDEEE